MSTRRDVRTLVVQVVDLDDDTGRVQVRVTFGGAVVSHAVQPVNLESTLATYVEDFCDGREHP